jgi:flagellar secretion chaperone FliS
MSSAIATARQYQQAQVATADRGRLLMLMFEGALKFLGRAEAALAEGELEPFAVALGRAEAVIAELLHTLDFKAGGEVARNLDRLYRFMLDHLVEANLRKSTVHVAQVARVLGIIASAYRDILDGAAHATNAA